jgi:CheY-like chemotaxis protein
MDPSSYVLIVEDEEDLRESLSELLQDAGYRTVPAANGAEALALLKQGAAPSVIVLDLMMPVMDGNELLQRIDAGEVTPRPNVLLMTAGQPPPDLRGRPFVRKPFDIESLVREVRRFAGGDG